MAYILITAKTTRIVGGIAFFPRRKRLAKRLTFTEWDNQYHRKEAKNK